MMRASAYLEKHLKRACSDILELDGWRYFPMEPVSRREWGKGTGEKGMCDSLYIRYLGEPAPRQVSIAGAAFAEVMWIEWKRIGPGRKTATKAEPHQKAWMEAERARGALVLCAGVDFIATFDCFLLWYRASGLLHRAGL